MIAPSLVPPPPLPKPSPKPAAEAPEAVPSTEPPQAPLVEETWYFVENQGVLGPYPTSAIREFLEAGRFGLDDQIKRSLPDAPWTRVRDEEIFAAFVPQEEEAGSGYATLALAGLWLGLIGLLVPLCGGVGLVSGIVAISFMRAAGQRAGRGLAVAAIIVGALNTVADPFKIMWIVSWSMK
jgi:hypothetical protein